MKTDIAELLGLRSPGSVHPPSQKLAASKKIEEIPQPQRVSLPFQQHIGAPATPVVEKGEQVKVGQKIAEATSYVSCPIHATISGTIKLLTSMLNPVTGRPTMGAIIESDGEDSWIDLQAANPEELSEEGILERVKDAGLVGLGGAGFPTHVKLKPPPDKPVRAIIVNGGRV